MKVVFLTWFLVGATAAALPESTARAAAHVDAGAYETTADAPLRRGPGNFHEVVTTLPKGIKINVVGREGYWLKVESKTGAQPGFIDEKFAKPLTTQSTQAAPPPSTSAASVAGPYRTLAEIQLREGPGANFRAVATLPAGIKVNVVRAEGDWLRVESKLGGKPGYLQRRDVERWVNR
jgi:uncharacterized protein YgiM (DUF1202 family)